VIQNKGNIRFRELVQSRKTEYFQSNTHKAKDTVARQVNQAVARLGGKFLSRVATLVERKRLGAPENAAVWVVVDDETALDKTKQTLREKPYIRAAPLSPGAQSESAPTARSEDSHPSPSAPSNGVVSGTRTDQGLFSSGSVPSVSPGVQIASLLAPEFDQMALLTRMQRDHSTSAAFPYQQLMSRPYANNFHQLALLQDVVDRDLQRIRDIAPYPPQQQQHLPAPGNNDHLAADMLRRHGLARAIRLQQQVKSLERQGMQMQAQQHETLLRQSFGPRHLLAGLNPNFIPHTMPSLGNILPGVAGLYEPHYQPASGLGGIDPRYLAFLQRQPAAAGTTPTHQSNPNDQRQTEAPNQQASKRKAGVGKSHSSETSSISSKSNPSAQKKPKL